jgi:hypothetical protein
MLAGKCNLNNRGKSRGNEMEGEPEGEGEVVPPSELEASQS